MSADFAQSETRLNLRAFAGESSPQPLHLRSRTGEGKTCMY